MVKIFSISIYRRINSKTFRIGITNNVHDVNYFFRNSMAETFAFISRSIVENKNPNNNLSGYLETKSNNVKHHITQLEQYPYYIHLLSLEELSVVMITDLDYPPRIGMIAVRKIFDLYSSMVNNKVIPSVLSANIQWEEAKLYNNTKDTKDIKDIQSKDINNWLTGILKDYSNPQNVDKLEKVKQLVEETKAQMVVNIEKVIQREEDLNVLIDKSQDLSNISKKYLKEAKRTNQCCKYY
jgi:synaptobrevin family protein YKT6